MFAVRFGGEVALYLPCFSTMADWGSGGGWRHRPDKPADHSTHTQHNIFIFMLKTFPPVGFCHRKTRMPIFAAVLVHARVAIDAGTALQTVSAVVFSFPCRLRRPRHVLLHSSHNLGRKQKQDYSECADNHCFVRTKKGPPPPSFTRC